MFSELKALGADTAEVSEHLLWSPDDRPRRPLTYRTRSGKDKTIELSDWHLPQAHYLESWGDARTPDGSVVAIQPLIEPLFGGVTEIEVLARIAELGKTNAVSA